MHRTVAHHSSCALGNHLNPVRMCFFEQVVWPCGYWRWSSFRQQCNKEYRIGETCGLKLVYGTKYRKAPCDTCNSIAKKSRMMAKKAADVNRWRGQRLYPATVEKTEKEIAILQRQLSRLFKQHQLMNLGK